MVWAHVIALTIQVICELKVVAQGDVGIAMRAEATRQPGAMPHDPMPLLIRTKMVRLYVGGDFRHNGFSMGPLAATKHLRQGSPREAAESCERLIEKPAQRNLSQAALETLAIVAYLGPCTRPDVTRIRGVAADSAVASLLERGLIAEAGRDEEAGGAIRYRTTPLFERVFGLESLSELPRLDDLGASVDEIRDRLHTVAEKRTA